jgi:uncharacterized protein YneF (UPF0154 family)
VRDLIHIVFGLFFFLFMLIVTFLCGTWISRRSLAKSFYKLYKVDDEMLCLFMQCRKNRVLSITWNFSAEQKSITVIV